MRRESGVKDGEHDEDEEEESPNEEDVSRAIKQPESPNSQEESVDEEQEALYERNRVAAKERQTERDKFVVARVDGVARAYYKVKNLTALERAVKKRDREKEQEYVPIGVESFPPHVLIVADPHNPKSKLPKSAIDLENKAKKSKKALKADVSDDSTNSPVVVKGARGGRGNGNVKGKGKGKGKN